MKKLYTVELEFEDENLAKDFIAYWLDGGGEQNFLSYDSEGIEAFYTTTNWDLKKYKNKTIKKLTIKRSDTKYE